MIDAAIGNEIDTYNQRATDALGYGVPGYQPSFHDVLSTKVRSIKTMDPLSVVAPQNSYFIVDNGDGTHSYSRGGDFRVFQGQLVDRDGRAVLGYPNGVEKGTLAPITVPANVPDGTIRIAADGTVSYGGAEKAPPTMPALKKPLMPEASTGAVPSYAQSSGGKKMSAGLSSGASKGASPSANTSDYDVPNIALDSDVNIAPVNLPANAGHVDAQSVLSQSPQAMLKSLGTHNEPDSQNFAQASAPTTATDSAMQASFEHGVKSGGPDKTAGIGTPLGKIALARFATGTTVSNDGASTSGPPIEMGPPGNGKIATLKVGFRDVGSVDSINSKLQVSNASSTLYALLQIETARQGNAKKAMDLVK